MVPGGERTSLLPYLAAYDQALQSQALDGPAGYCDWLDGLAGELANGQCRPGSTMR